MKVTVMAMAMAMAIGTILVIIILVMVIVIVPHTILLGALIQNPMALRRDTLIGHKLVMLNSEHLNYRLWPQIFDHRLCRNFRRFVLKTLGCSTLDRCRAEGIMVSFEFGIF